MNYEDCITDEECSVAYHREIRQVNKRNPQRYDCPTCGAKGELSAHEKQSGYHWSVCTSAAEGCC